MYKIIKDLGDKYVAATRDPSGTLKCVNDADPYDMETLPERIIAKLINGSDARCYDPDNLREAASYDARDPYDREEFPVKVMVYLDQTKKVVQPRPSRPRMSRNEVSRLQSAFLEAMNRED